MKRLLLGAVFLVSACAGGDGPTPVESPVATILVTAPSMSLVVGAGVQATATTLNKGGTAVTGQTVVWSSSNQTVASVSNSGFITAIAAGSSIVRASVGAVVGELNITVDIDRCLSPLTMQPGEVKLLSGPDAVACVTIAASTAASDYLFITANGGVSLNDTRQYMVSASGAGPSTAIASGAMASITSAADATDLRDAVEAHIREYEQRAFRTVTPGQLYRVAKGLRSGANLSVTAAAEAPGDTITLRVPNAAAADLCTTFATIRAEVMAVGRKAQIVQDVTSPANGFTAADFQTIAAEFDDVIAPVDESWFGPATDVNVDGKVTILYTPEVNKLTPEGALGFVGGFFFSRDLLPRSLPVQNYSCPQSNFREIFYLLSPDPRGEINHNIRTVGTVRQTTRGTIAHEFQHMINQGIRFDSPAAVAEAVWLNEALSHLAEEIVGRAVRGYADTQRLAYSDLIVNPADYDAYFRQNLGRFRTWMLRPDTASAISNRADAQLAPRGAAWALLRYAIDQYSNGNARLFTQRLVSGPEGGVQNLTARAGVSFDEILPGFLIGNFASGLNVSGLTARYGYASWNIRDAMTNYSQGTFPLAVTGLPAQINTQSLAGSGNYFRLTRPANSPVSTFRMQSTTGGLVEFLTARVYVVRLN